MREDAHLLHAFHSLTFHSFDDFLALFLSCPNELESKDFAEESLEDRSFSMALEGASKKS